MFELTQRETLFLRLYQQALDSGRAFVPTPDRKKAKGLRAQAYSCGNRLRRAELRQPEAAPWCRLIEQVSLYVDEDGPPGLGFRRKDLDPMNVLLAEAVLQAGAPELEAPMIEATGQAKELKEMADRLFAMQEAGELGGSASVNEELEMGRALFGAGGTPSPDPSANPLPNYGFTPRVPPNHPLFKGGSK